MMLTDEMANSLIQNVFDDNRKIVKVEENKNFEDKLFFTNDGEIVIIKLFDGVSFNSKVLADYTELVENIFFYFQKRVNLYIITKPNVSVDVEECTINSEADFTIKLTTPCINLDEFDLNDVNVQCDLVLDIIKRKIEEKDISEEEIEALEMIPMVCKKEDRKYYREQVFDLMTQIKLEFGL